MAGAAHLRFLRIIEIIIVAKDAMPVAVVVGLMLMVAMLLIGFSTVDEAHDTELELDT